jgi:hypothetical protein
MAPSQAATRGGNRAWISAAMHSAIERANAREGRALREKGLGLGSVTMQASGLSPEEFPLLQKAIVRLRDNLMKAADSAP